MNIVFMGTPDFAVFQLEALLEAGHRVSAVFCQPDKPQGRHQELTPPECKVAALKYGIEVFQPQTLKKDEAFAILKRLNPDVIVVAAYGKLLPKRVLELPRYGCINVHGSLLPKYRGAAPIQRAIIEGEKLAGVTIMQMAEGMDTGDMLMQSQILIGDNERADELFTRLAILGADALIKTLQKIDELKPVKQDDEKATWASPLKKEDGLLNFKDKQFEIYRRFLGTYPWPGSYFEAFGKRVKVLEMHPIEGKGKHGELLSQKELIIACADGALKITRVNPEGKKPMDGVSYINGQRLKKGDILTKE